MLLCDFDMLRNNIECSRRIKVLSPSEFNEAVSGYCPRSCLEKGFMRGRA